MSIRDRLAREGREVYSARDCRGLSLPELLTCLLRSEDLSRAVLDRFPTPTALAQAEAADLLNVSGISWGRAEQVLAAFELAARARNHAPGSEPLVRTPREVHALLADRFRGLKKELFLALYLSTRNRVLKVETVSEGTLNASLVHPREVFRGAIQLAAASLIVAHNHPSGEPEPSDDDLAITGRLANAGEVVGIPLLDHVIVAGDRFFSLKEEGHI